MPIGLSRGERRCSGGLGGPPRRAPKKAARLCRPRTRASPSPRHLKPRHFACAAWHRHPAGYYLLYSPSPPRETLFVSSLSTIAIIQPDLSRLFGAYNRISSPPPSERTGTYHHRTHSLSITHTHIRPPSLHSRPAASITQKPQPLCGHRYIHNIPWPRSSSTPQHSWRSKSSPPILLYHRD
jgi:hypothetical protein